MPHDPQRYHRQIQEARRIALRMTGETLERFREILEEYAERLATFIGRSGRDATELVTDRFFLDTVDRILDEMAVDLARATSDAITYTVREVAEIHARATAQLLAGEGVLAIGGTGAVGTRVLQAYLARPELSAAFVSIRRESVAIVDGILQRAALEGVSGPQLAMQLRTHIVGAEAIPRRYLLDRRRIGYEALRFMGLEPTPKNLQAMRKAAGRVATRAELIARTEPMGAQHEARVVAAEESPVVAMLHWRLSYQHPKRDICDALAERDLFGLGPGLYDPRRVPPRPHPRCLCMTIDVLRPVEEWGTPRGRIPELMEDADSIAERYEFTPSERRQLAAVLRTTTTRRARRAA